MELKRIGGEFTVCRLLDVSGIDLELEYCFWAKTDEEISLVCRTEDVPEHTLKREEGWRAFRIQGELDFSLIGILAGISSLLAKEKIGIFVISTYRTDYVLVKKEQYEKALEVLERAGYTVV
ncbi:MAG: ACT domain-containing protein [Lachnospiraceae bacterium]|nr:ACT domain-containing protein [Lachnospiraceae bacterium]